MGGGENGRGGNDFKNGTSIIFGGIVRDGKKKKKKKDTFDFSPAYFSDNISKANSPMDPDFNFSADILGSLFKAFEESRAIPIGMDSIVLPCIEG